MRIAVVGSGISGIAAAGVLKRFGHDPVLFEQSEQIGGIWAHTYPQVRLQNSAAQYHFADFPWPFPPDLHPTAEQIHRYLRAAVEHLGLEVRRRHEVVSLELDATQEAWTLEAEGPERREVEHFSRVVIAAGQYSGESTPMPIPGREAFGGEVVTERGIADLGKFEGRKVAVVGFGKTAVDLASLAAQRADRVTHVFRTPRWLIPRTLFGLHFTYPMFPRASTSMMPSWSHPNAFESSLHRRGAGLVRGYWKMLEWVFTGLRKKAAFLRGPAARERIAAVAPPHRLVGDMRSALALAPDRYFEWVAEGYIDPRCSAVTRFVPSGLELASGESIACDLVVLALGTRTPTFPYLKPELRHHLEGHHDGVQLYRHILHPRIPRLAFAGFNHGFLHVPSVEVATLWLCALWRGDLALPALEVMEREIDAVREWKRGHVHFEPSRSCAVNTRFQQHIDLLLRDLGLSPYRKLPNALAECFGRYGPSDYAGLIEDYERSRQRAPALRKPLPLAG